MIGTAEQDAFIREHHFAIVTTLRKDGSPSNSAIFVFADGDELAFSTTADRLKAKTVKNDPRVAVTLADGGEPHRYVTVEGKATIDSDNIVPMHITLNKLMQGPDWQPPAGFEEGLRKAGRVVVRIHPDRVSDMLNRPTGGPKR